MAVSGQTTYLLLRDSAMFVYLWVSGRRAQDMLYVNWGDLYLQLPDRSLVAALPFWHSSRPDRDYSGFHVLVTPSRSISEHCRRPITQTLAVQTDMAMRATRRLHATLLWCDGAVAVTPQQAAFATLHGARLSSDAVGKRVKDRLLQYSLYEGESRHSFRRGRIQACQASSQPTDVTMQRVGITIACTFKKYADPGRHLR